MPQKSASGQRDLGLQGGGAGKGDADRSPGWRDKYDNIEWRSKKGDDGFRRFGSRLIKAYGTAAEKLLNEQSNQSGGDVPPVQ